MDKNVVCQFLTEFTKAILVGDQSSSPHKNNNGLDLTPCITTSNSQLWKYLLKGRDRELSSSIATQKWGTVAFLLESIMNIWGNNSFRARSPTHLSNENLVLRPFLTKIEFLRLNFSHPFLIAFHKRILKASVTSRVHHHPSPPFHICPRLFFLHR